MKIYITNPNANSNGSVVEMFLLEFQGEIETLAGEFRGQTLGELQVFDNAQAGGKLKYGIDIGIHHLEGEGKKLDKPLLITKSVVSEIDKTSLEVVGVCREKIVFNKRPAPVLRQELKKMKQTV